MTFRSDENLWFSVAEDTFDNFMMAQQRASSSDLRAARYRERRLAACDVLLLRPLDSAARVDRHGRRVRELGWCRLRRSLRRPSIRRPSVRRCCRPVAARDLDLGRIDGRLPLSAHDHAAGRR